jgi:hypothetical protein
MWAAEPTTAFQKDLKFYAKRHPNELAAVLRNVDRYLAQLNCSSNSKSVQAGYLHREPMGVVAVDQKGGGPNLQETRLYTFADEAKNVLYLYYHWE